MLRVRQECLLCRLLVAATIRILLFDCDCEGFGVGFSNLFFGGEGGREKEKQVIQKFFELMSQNTARPQYGYTRRAVSSSVRCD